MKFIILTSSCLRSEEDKLISISKVGLLNSIIKFQQNLLMGLKMNINDSLSCINYYPIGFYPIYSKKMFFKKTETSIENLSIFNISFINIPFFKYLTLTYNMHLLLKKWISDNKDEDKCIIMYDLLYPCINSVLKIKKMNKDVLIGSVIADLPNQYGYEKNEQLLRRIIKRYMGRRELKLIQSFDFHILLTEQMKDIVHSKQNRYMIMEGFSTVKEYIPYKENDKKIVMYSGTLNSVYGLDILVSAFMKIEDLNYELWICGNGDYKETLIMKSKLDSRIKYYGFLSLSRVYELENKSTVLVNPRQNVSAYTKYSFPSKILEYLSTGRPVIAYKLDGIPDSYYSYIYYPKDNSVNSLKEKILEVCEMSIDSRKLIGQKSRDYVIYEKSPKKQCGKIINFIKNIRLL